MTKFLNSDGLSRLVALIKQALGGKQDTLVSGTNIKTINDTSLLGSGNIILGAEDVIYSGDENYNLQAGDDLNQSLDNLDTAIHNLDNIVGEEILTPTIVEHSYIVRDPAASRGNLSTSNPWRVEVFKGLSEGENLLVTYTGTDTNGSAQVAGWYTDGDNLISDNFSSISNLDGYAQNIVGKTYLITVPNSTIKALALSLYTTVQAEVKRIGTIQAEIHEIENPNEIESISTTESSVSGGNNTVTITETNGTTTTFNVKNGVDGVSLGEVGLVQTTGNATDKVMSQNAVTEYGRKVATEDLAGTSDWSKSVLEDNGWVMGAYVTGDTTTANADLCTTHFIPINDISGHNVVFYFGHSNSGARIQFYLENKTYKDFYGTSPANKRTQLIAASLSTCRWIRMACGINVISQCYIYDNSTDEYIWKGDEYIDRLVRDKKPVLDYGFFEDNIVKQTEGNSETSVMSQKAVTKQTVRFTEGDLTGTGDWIKAKLQELGWAFDSRLNNVGEVVEQSGYAATAFIPVGNLSGHSITFGFMYNSYSNGNICFYTGNKVFTSGHYYNTAANNSRDVTPSAAFSSDSYIRMTCNPLRISECYIYDNTEGEYIWRGDEYLEELYKNNLINYENFRDLLVAQEVGDSTTKTMSQKAVTEYGRKVTAEDLAGTSDWIRAKLTEEGWTFDKYIGSGGGLGDATGYCVSPYIPISGVEGKNIWFYGGEFTNGTFCTCVYNSDKTKLTYLAYTEKPRKYSFGSYSTSIAYIRTTFKISDIAKCYVYNNTNGKYLFKMEEYLVGLFNENGLNVSSKFLEEDIIKQETGESTIKTMSQKAITDAINYNINIQHGKGINTAQDWTWLKLTPKAVSLLNASEKMTFMFSTRGTGNSQDYRYFGFGSSSTSKANTWDADGAWLYWSYSANLGCKQKDYNLNLYNSKRPTPDVWIVTWDRVTGTVSFYDRTTKLTTLTSDNYKCDHFVNANGTIVLKTGDNRTRIYDIRLFDYDISVLFGSADIAQEIKYLDGAGTPPSQFDGNYGAANDDSSFSSSVNSFQGGGYAATCTYTLDGSDYHIVVKDGVTSSQVCGGKPYYLGRDYKAQINILNFEVVSGVIKASYDGHTTSILYKITDSNGDEIEDYNNIGVGTYTLTRSSFGPCARLDFYKVSGDVEVVINSTCYYKPISCVFHLKCNTLYNNMLYDEQTDEFYKIYTNYTCTTESTAHVMVDTPQRVIRDNIASSGGLPHYRGEMAVYNGNVYIGMHDYTWKQINNS